MILPSCGAGLGAVLVLFSENGINENKISGMGLEGVMKSREPKGEVSALKPAGVVFAAVVAGLGAAKTDRAAGDHQPRAPLEPASQSNTYFVDPTNHPGFEEDPNLVVGPSEPVAVFSGAGSEQADLFKR